MRAARTETAPVTMSKSSSGAVESRSKRDQGLESLPKWSRRLVHAARALISHENVRAAPQCDIRLRCRSIRRLIRRSAREISQDLCGAHPSKTSGSELANLWIDPTRILDPTF